MNQKKKKHAFPLAYLYPSQIRTCLYEFLACEDVDQLMSLIRDICLLNIHI